MPDADAGKAAEGNVEAASASVITETEKMTGYFKSLAPVMVDANAVLGFCRATPRIRSSCDTDM